MSLTIKILNISLLLFLLLLTSCQIDFGGNSDQPAKKALQLYQKREYKKMYDTVVGIPMKNYVCESEFLETMQLNEKLLGYPIKITFAGDSIKNSKKSSVGRYIQDGNTPVGHYVYDAVYDGVNDSVLIEIGVQNGKIIKFKTTPKQWNVIPPLVKFQSESLVSALQKEDYDVLYNILMDAGKKRYPKPYFTQAMKQVYSHIKGQDLIFNGVFVDSNSKDQIYLDVFYKFGKRGSMEIRFFYTEGELEFAGLVSNKD